MATSTKTVRVELTGDPSSLERSLTVVSEKSSATAAKMEGHAVKIGGAFGKLDSLLGGFGIPFTGALSVIGEKLDGLGTKGESTFKKLSNAGGVALAAIGVAAVGIGIESIHLADKFEESHARLEGAIKNVGGSFDEYAGKIDGVDKKLEGFGFTNTETEGALATLTRAAGDTGKALGLMGLAADLARARHISLDSAVGILSKVVTGHVALLGRYGIATKDAAGNTLSVEQAVDALQKKFGGQAATSAETFQGKVKVLEAQLTDIGIKIGTVLIPIIEDLVSAITDVINWFEKHKAAAIALAGVITTVLGAAIAVFVYDKVAAFVGGIQRMLTGLGLLKVQAEETAAAVEASGATIAESSAVGGAGGVAGAGAAIGGAEVAGGEAAGGIEAAGASASLALGPILLIGAAAVGAAYGMQALFGGSNSVSLSFRGLATNDVPRLTQSIETNRAKINEVNGVIADWGAHISNTKINHQEFNTVLEKSPQDAQAFIEAVGRAGGSTEWYSNKLREHIVASEQAKVSQERFALQMEIVDAKARGDAGAVYGLTLQLNALPTDKQIEIAADTSQAHGAIDALWTHLNNFVSTPFTVSVGVIGAGIAKAQG